MGTPLFERLRIKMRGEALLGKKKSRMPNFRRMVWLDPSALTEEYRRFITATLTNWYLPYEEEMARVISNYFPRFRADNVETEWELINAKLLTAQKELFSDGNRGNFLGAIFPFGTKVSQFNNDQFQKFMKVSIGEALPLDEPYLQPALTKWSTENYDLIKSMSEQYITETNELVQKAVSKGLVYSEVMAELRATGAAVSRTRAQLVSRDQIGKLNGALTQARQENAGIEEYDWDTSADERVRGNPSGKYPKAIPSHYIMDQRICRWDDRTVWRNAKGDWVKRDPKAPQLHPGEDIQCRCVGLPRMDEIWAEAANAVGMEAEAVDVAPEDQALTKLHAVPPNQSNVEYLGLKGYAGENALDTIPFALDTKLFEDYGQLKQYNFSDLESLKSTFSKSTVKQYLQEGIPDTPIKAVTYQGKKYVMPQTSNMARLGALHFQGQNRAKMLSVNLDEVMKTKTPKPTKVKIPKAKKPKAVQAVDLANKKKLLAAKKTDIKNKKAALKEASGNTSELRKALTSQQAYIKHIENQRDLTEKLARKRVIKGRPESPQHAMKGDFVEYTQGFEAKLNKDLASGKLTPDQVKAMRAYISDTSNKAWAAQLRGKTPLDNPTAKNTALLDQYLADNKTPGDIVLYRGLALPRELDFKVGDKKSLFDPMFVSMTSDPSTADTFASRNPQGNKYVIRFNAKKGDPLVPIAKRIDNEGKVGLNYNEREFVAPRGTSFVIREITNEKTPAGFRIVDAEILK